MTKLAGSKRTFLKLAVLGAAAIVGSAAMTACESTGGDGNTLEQVKESKSVRIGIANEQPYGFADASGNVTGEAPAVAREVFKTLGVDDVQASVVPFDQLIPGLNAGKFDVVAAGMFITPKRCEQAAFSTPDYSAKTALLVPRGNPEGVRTLADVAAKNVTLTVLSAAVEKDYAEAAGVPADKITTLDSQDNMLRAVADGRVYAAALTDISLQWLVKQNPDVPVEVTESFVPKDADGKDVVSAGAFVFRKDDNDLRTAFDAELKKLHDSGRWVELAGEFGFTESNVPTAATTTDEFCAA